MAISPSFLANKLSILAINVNSIRTNVRRHNLVDLIDETNPDIVALSETRLNHRHMFSIENYNIIRNDRLSNDGGGTAILIRKSIPHSIINLTNIKSIETTIIKIKHDSKNLFVISTYIPPRPTEKIHNDLNLIFTSLKLREPNNYYILIGYISK